MSSYHLSAELNILKIQASNAAADGRSVEDKIDERPRPGKRNGASIRRPSNDSAGLKFAGHLQRRQILKNRAHPAIAGGVNQCRVIPDHIQVKLHYPPSSKIAGANRKRHYRPGRDCGIGQRNTYLTGYP